MDEANAIKCSSECMQCYENRIMSLIHFIGEDRRKGEKLMTVSDTKSI